MAKASKPKPARKKRGNYEEPLQVNGSFLDLMKASMKHADNHSAKKGDAAPEKKKP